MHEAFTAFQFLQENPQLATIIGQTSGALILGIIGFSKLQHDWIKRRDGNSCQLADDKLHRGIPCGGRLEVDHVLPKALAPKVGVPNPNTPENGITICQNVHRGMRGSKHHGRWFNLKFFNTEREIAQQNTTIYQREHPKDKFPTK